MEQAHVLEKEKRKVSGENTANSYTLVFLSKGPHAP